MAEKIERGDESSLSQSLERMGWEFLQYGPSEWQWIKFDADGRRVAIQGDATWRSDHETISKTATSATIYAL